MDEQSARSLYEQRIENIVTSLLPHGAGTLSETRLRFALSQVAQVAFSAGHDFALFNLTSKAGSVSSDAKQKSSRENGKLGGRPKGKQS